MAAAGFARIRLVTVLDKNRQVSLNNSISQLS